MRCINCSADLPENADFCPVCHSTQPEREETPAAKPVPELTAVAAQSTAIAMQPTAAAAQPAVDPLVIIPSAEPPLAMPPSDIPERPNYRLVIGLCAAIACLLIIQLIVFAVGRAHRPRLPANAAPIYLDEEQAPVPVAAP